MNMPWGKKKETKQAAAPAALAGQNAVEQTGAAPAKKPGAQGSVLYELLILLLKIAAIMAVIVVLFTFLFGVTRVQDVSMYPAVKDGDLVMFYRLDKNFVKDEIAVLNYNGDRQVRRVVAVAGDEVDIDLENNRLILNGSPQIEPDIRELTARFDTDIDFPLTVGEGQIFVLGDGREHAVDSRMYGCVNAKDTLGKASVILRTRGL